MKKINVIGHLSSSSGLGNTARLFIQVLRSRGYEVAGLDVDDNPDLVLAMLPDICVVKKVEELPFDINLIIVSIQVLPSFWRRRFPALLSARFKNVGLVFFELSVIPAAWLPSLKIFDALMVCSNYVRQALETALPAVPTIFAEHPLKLPIKHVESSITRLSLGLLPSDLVFASSFDLRSDFARKNPLAVLNAFQKAFPEQNGVRLLIKANGKPQGEDVHPVVREILERVATDPRIVLVTETMPYEKVLALYSACDVFVSLHRSEGLGLGPMEAMLLGKLVIATGYSGNLTYMSEQNALLVPYSLVPPAKTVWFFDRAFAGENAAWAEPDVDAAVKSLRIAFEQPAHSMRLALAGKNSIVARQLTAWNAEWLTEFEKCVNEAKPNNHKRLAHRRRIMFNEIIVPTLRARNFEALKSGYFYKKFRDLIFKN